MSFLLLSEPSMPVVLVCVGTEKAVSCNNVSVPVRHHNEFGQVSIRIQGLGIAEMPKISQQKRECG
jgi:GMP synthase-like glutamine amidotransferase